MGRMSSRTTTLSKHHPSPQEQWPSPRPGLFSDPSYYTSRGNHFQYNTYYYKANSRPFFWMSEHIGWKRWVGYGQDTRGTFVRD